jgi:hypothetical protein
VCFRRLWPDDRFSSPAYGCLRTSFAHIRRLRGRVGRQDKRMAVTRVNLSALVSHGKKRNSVDVAAVAHVQPIRPSAQDCYCR